MEVLGLPECGVATVGPFNRATGEGWVRETTTHQYADGQRRGHPVTLLACESTSALSPAFYQAFRALDRESRLSTTHDSTVYGVGRASPRGFLAHHLAAHSSGIVMANAATVHTFGSQLNFRLAAGVAA